MTNQQPKAIHLKDYQPPHYLVDTIDLDFHLYETHTEVESKISFKRNQGIDPKTPLILQGENLKLKSISLNEKMLSSDQYQMDEEELRILNVPENFTLEIKTEIFPDKNTELSGLYRSKKLYCTQCEAQGFRRITYYPDRPDVMAKFTTTIHADMQKYPVLLSNGNCVKRGLEEDGRHWATWEDPFKKPCYLFALVAGDLVALEEFFVTRSGRFVTLKIFVERENQDKCAHAMAALKKAMKWDEETYGREYDLDIYMIVAVNDFNMGAMENKGLNIFNSKYILARPETASDRDFQNIDSVVGHEYFHNWSGNRITCRDWFQLSLKEGLTVFREHQFSSDINKSKVSLIENVIYLRSVQFAEDAGPMAHPVRPESYVEINNFYTTTIYEKGAEVIRMLKTLLGWETFRKGMDHYFEKFDGQAVTTDDFVTAHEEASGKDLSQFRLWYNQAGTPEIEVIEKYDQAKKTYHLTLKQFIPNTPGQTEKKPMVIPVAIGLIDEFGSEMLPETRVLEFNKQEDTFSFPNIQSKPRLSIFRDFSAPVKIKSAQSDEDLVFLLANDTNDFNRWDAGQKLTERMILRLVELKQEKKALLNDPQWMKVHHGILQHKTLNPAMKAMILTLPNLSYLVELTAPNADPDALYAAKKVILSEIALAWHDELYSFYCQYQTPGVYQYTTENADRRTLKNLCLAYLLESAKPPKEMIELVVKQWKNANNMTDAFAAISIISNIDVPERQEMLQEFYDRWQHDPLVIDKWLRVQATSILPNTLDTVKGLMKHPAFSINNPNKVYSLIGGFTSNLVRFHEPSGLGYKFLADTVIELDGKNPQVASRMVNAFTHWRKYEPGRRDKMKLEIERIKSQPKLSPDVYEIVTKSLSDIS